MTTWTCDQCRSVTLCNPNEFCEIGRTSLPWFALHSKAPAVPKCLDPSREKGVHASVRAQQKSTENWVKLGKTMGNCAWNNSYRWGYHIGQLLYNEERKKKVGSTQAQRCGMAQKKRWNSRDLDISQLNGGCSQLNWVWLEEIPVVVFDGS